MIILFFCIFLIIILLLIKYNSTLDYYTNIRNYKQVSIKIPKQIHTQIPKKKSIKKKKILHQTQKKTQQKHVRFKNTPEYQFIPHIKPQNISSQYIPPQKPQNISSQYIPPQYIPPQKPQNISSQYIPPQKPQNISSQYIPPQYIPPQKPQNISSQYIPPQYIPPQKPQNISSQKPSQKNPQYIPPQIPSPKTSQIPPLNIQDKVFKGIIYKSNDKNTKYEYMIQSEENYKALFIYNENEEQFKSKSIINGGGNAIIREYRVDIENNNHKLFDRNINAGSALGIPTGSNGRGYENKTKKNQQIIDESIENINQYLKKNKDTNIIYWSCNNQHKLGTGIFNIGKDIDNYILIKLIELAVEHKFNMDPEPNLD
jgi:hypothetical protein